MIAHLYGTLDSKRGNSVVIDVNGAGYEVFLTPSTLLSLPNNDSKIKLYIIESTAMYGGATTLYGFISEEEKAVFLLLKDEVQGTGAKKALEYLDKAAKSIGDFRRSIVNKDPAALTGIFGFTKKTADKLISSLKDKAGLIQLPLKEKHSGGGRPRGVHFRADSPRLPREPGQGSRRQGDGNRPGQSYSRRDH